MVKRPVFIVNWALIAIAQIALAETSRTQIESGEDLLKYMKAQANTKGDIINDDFYARQVDPMSDSLWYLIEEPRRKRFPGLILPNGLVAPAIVDEYQKKHPACIDRHLTLHFAQWNASEGKLVCNLKQTELLDTEQAQQTQLALGTVAQAGDPTNTQASTRDAAFVDNHHYVLAKGKNSPRLEGSLEPSPQEISKDTGSITEKMAKQGRLTDIPAERSSAIQQGSNSQTQTRKSQPSEIQTRSTKPDNPYIYNPTRSAQKTGTQFFIFEESGRNYGIPIGTWVKAELKTSANSADSGYAELTLIQSLNGTRKTLERGTKLFANKALNWGTERMDLSVRKVLTPDLEEFSIQAKVYDFGKREGLGGVLKRRRKEEIKALGSKTAFKTLSKAIPQGETLVGDAVSGLGDDLVDQEQAYMAQVPRGTIEVTPQIVWVKIEKSF